MERQVSLSEITDGRLYGSNDMVKVGCYDCEGCFACCQGMGNSIILDPLDVHRISSGLHCTFEQLLADNIQLNMADGIILPNLKQSGEQERCSFLNDKGRCGIHPIRPGVCRLFPLGRYYEDHGFHYILQVNECKKDNKTKVKVRKWIDTPDLKEYEQFVMDWHYFLKELRNAVKDTQDDSLIKNISMYVLKQFYQIPYDETSSFYVQFRTRLDVGRRDMCIVERIEE